MGPVTILPRQYKFVEGTLVPPSDVLELPTEKPFSWDALEKRLPFVTRPTAKDHELERRGDVRAEDSWI